MEALLNMGLSRVNQSHDMLSQKLSASQIETEIVKENQRSTFRKCWKLYVENEELLTRGKLFDPRSEGTKKIAINRPASCII